MKEYQKKHVCNWRIPVHDVNNLLESRDINRNFNYVSRLKHNVEGGLFIYNLSHCNSNPPEIKAISELKNPPDTFYKASHALGLGILAVAVMMCGSRVALAGN